MHAFFEELKITKYEKHKILHEATVFTVRLASSLMYSNATG